MPFLVAIFLFVAVVVPAFGGGPVLFGLFEEKRTPAPHELVEFVHRYAQWPQVCEPHVDLDSRRYDADSGTLKYRWTGTEDQEDACMREFPGSGPVILYRDEYEDLPTDMVCRENFETYDNRLWTINTPTGNRGSAGFEVAEVWIWVGQHDDYRECPGFDPSAIPNLGWRVAEGHLTEPGDGFGFDIEFVN